MSGQPPQSVDNILCDNFLERLQIGDDVLAEQFYSLPVKDRNAINEEIHGVQSMACVETSESIVESLRLLSIELEKLPMQYRLIYRRACEPRIGDPPAQRNFCYVKSENFQLAFLRCEFFDAKKAALRMAKYLELVYDLYGEEALRRPLRVDDFQSKEEIEVMDAGHQQLLPFRDRCGRRVLFVHGDMNLPSSSLKDRSILSKGPAMKVLLYIWSVLLEDVEAQRKGLVVIFWPRYIDHSDRETTFRSSSRPPPRKKKANLKQGVGKQHTSSLSNEVPDANSRSTGKVFFEALPVRVTSMHICLPDIPYLRMIRNILVFILGDNFRSRVKFHDGKDF